MLCGPACRSAPVRERLAGVRDDLAEDAVVDDAAVARALRGQVAEHAAQRRPAVGVRAPRPCGAEVEEFGVASRHEHQHATAPGCAGQPCAPAGAPREQERRGQRGRERQRRPTSAGAGDDPHQRHDHRARRGLRRPGRRRRRGRSSRRSRAPRARSRCPRPGTAAPPARTPTARLSTKRGDLAALEVRSRAAPAAHRHQQQSRVEGAQRARVRSSGTRSNQPGRT